MSTPSPNAVLDEPTLRAMNSFAPAERRTALLRAAEAVRTGRVVPPPETGWVNLHAHTFFSFSSEDYSPTRLVWEARRRGLSAVGSTDFDVLDAMDETYAAGSALGIRTTVSLETRTFVDAYADREINSPGEPGVMYAMGAGFVRLPNPADAAGRLFAGLLEQSRRRNMAMLERTNAVTAPVRVDYAGDVLPLTPSGNATERHICAAYDNVARRVFPDPEALAAYWAGVLGKDAAAVAMLLADAGAFRNAVRAKLMKKGGPGYAQPDHGAFPPIRDFFAMALSAGAVPCFAWLDGMSAGEADPDRLLDDAVSWGARTVNIIPDRNWNFSDAAVKAGKTAALAAFVAAARARHMPILAGTEMNSPGQKFVDSFDAPELAPYVRDFRDAAAWLHAHCLLEGAAGMGASGPWAAGVFGNDRAAANAFYVEVGEKAAPAPDLAARAGRAAPDMSPAEVLAVFR